MHQHDRVATAFAAQRFMGTLNKVADRDQFEIVWCTDATPLPWTNQFTPILGEMNDAVSEYLSGVPDYYRDNVGLRYTDGSTPHTIHISHNIALDDTDVCVRILWSFLSIFNKVPIVGEQLVTRSHGFVASGRHHRFLAHKVLTITVPQRAGRKAVRRTLAYIRRRAHQVRGHWRDDWRLPTRRHRPRLCRPRLSDQARLARVRFLRSAIPPLRKARSGR